MWQIRQRVLSNAEPELGLGLVEDLDKTKGFVFINFLAVNECRRYSIKNSPLSHYIFKVGQTIHDLTETPYQIQDIQKEHGLVKYITANKILWEDELSPTLRLDSSDYDQLFQNKIFPPQAFDLRSTAWELQSSLGRINTAGILGCRVQLLPHQLYLAQKISNRYIPRALLADEVGLGKTIEAGLVFASLKATGRANKVLIIVPDSLIHQWTAEMFRRFEQLFSLLDETRCAAEESSLQASPFESNTNVIVPISLFIHSSKRLEQASKISWDLVIVDESHHLAWDLEKSSRKWLAVETLSKVSKGLLLLTGTPKQQGLTTQFGLLKLLDPLRFSNFEAYITEVEQTRQVAACAKKLLTKKADTNTLQLLKKLFAKDTELLNLIKTSTCHQTNLDIISKLIDRHSTGHYIFRNKRKKIKGFPKRITYFPKLKANAQQTQSLQEVDIADLSPKEILDYSSGRFSNATLQDLPPRFIWLKQFISEHSKEKLLILCSSKETVCALVQYLSTSIWPQAKRVSSVIAVFHENQSIIDRDKQAAHFAKSTGPNILVSSEIGGEGRNFQFVKHLILMDIPTNPETLQQRIGRLDRIGQGKSINIYLPYLEKTPEEVLYKWYQEGLQAFAAPNDGGSIFIEELGEQLLNTLSTYFPTHHHYPKREDQLSKLLKDTQSFVSDFNKEQEETTDVILELNSYNEKKAQQLLEEIDMEDDNPNLELFTRAFFDYYHIDYDDYDDYGSILIKTTLDLENIPGFKLEEGNLITFDRNIALKRDDMLFFSLNHPLVQNMISLFISRNEGALSFCKWQNSSIGRGFIIELLFIVDCKAPAHLEIEKYLPITCKKIFIDQNGKQFNLKEEELLVSNFDDMDLNTTQQMIHNLKIKIEPYLDNTITQMESWTNTLKEEALSNIRTKESEIIGRLRYLKNINKNVTSLDLKQKQEDFNNIKKHIKHVSARLDSVRIIFSES